MLIVLSPAKTLDFETPLSVSRHSQPEFLDQSRELVDVLAPLDRVQLAELMKISDALASLNVARFGAWKPPFTPDNARQAVLAFAGDVYEGLQAATLGEADLVWAQDHLRILSGLYGLLRPLDLIQPYRLEMGTRLENPRGRDLYAFWGERLAAALRAQLSAHAHPVLVNLASEEYFKAVPLRALGHPVLQPVFQERKGAAWKVVSFHAKRARGAMARWAIEHRIEDPKLLERFDRDGYAFAPQASGPATMVFRRAG